MVKQPGMREVAHGHELTQPEVHKRSLCLPDEMSAEVKSETMG